jgi:hypothetical protein
MPTQSNRPVSEPLLCNTSHMHAPRTWLPGHPPATPDGASGDFARLGGGYLHGRWWWGVPRTGIVGESDHSRVRTVYWDWNIGTLAFDGSGFEPQHQWIRLYALDRFAKLVRREKKMSLTGIEIAVTLLLAIHRALLLSHKHTRTRDSYTESHTHSRVPTSF